MHGDDSSSRSLQRGARKEERLKKNNIKSVAALINREPRAFTFVKRNDQDRSRAKAKMRDKRDERNRRNVREKDEEIERERERERKREREREREGEGKNEKTYTGTTLPIVNYYPQHRLITSLTQLLGSRCGTEIGPKYL